MTLLFQVIQSEDLFDKNLKHFVSLFCMNRWKTMNTFSYLSCCCTLLEMKSQMLSKWAVQIFFGAKIKSVKENNHQFKRCEC